MPMSPEDRDRITRLEVQMEQVHNDVLDLKIELKSATDEWRKLITEFRIALINQGLTIKKPLDQLSGGWKVITILAAIAVGAGTIATDIITLIEHLK